LTRYRPFHRSVSPLGAVSSFPAVAHLIARSSPTLSRCLGFAAATERESRLSFTNVSTLSRTTPLASTAPRVSRLPRPSYRVCASPARASYCTFQLHLRTSFFNVAVTCHGMPALFVIPHLDRGTYAHARAHKGNQFRGVVAVRFTFYCLPVAIVCVFYLYQPTCTHSRLLTAAHCATSRLFVFRRLNVLHQRRVLQTFPTACCVL